VTFSILDLFKVESATSFLAGIIADAQSLGLLVTSWRVGDPTRATFTALARALATKEGALAEFAKSAFLSESSGDWLTILASEVYNVDRGKATYAVSNITVTNTGGGVYPIAARDWVFKNTISGKTYRNVSAMPTLLGGQTITIDVEATEPGSASSSLANEIDALVTTRLGVVVVSSTAAVGVDAQDDEPLREQCRASRGALSPNGPADAYEYVVRNPILTGVTDITRAKSSGDNPNLNVTIYVAGNTGPVAGASVTAAQTAVEKWATPLTITPTVVNASALIVNVTYSAHGDSPLPSTTGPDVQAALLDLFRNYPIGEGAGYNIDPTDITTAIRTAAPKIKMLPAYTPNTLVHVAAGQAPVLGTVTFTEV
jgi:hypothetical protein